ncbi:TIGR03617 family F420-dependent LLM class oxidoreductase [Acidiferrimicrobium sp. IK]|uniref:TIGR03617 family F420-dependent LLM class oxidoreductase n=1 Tax=Acidiferrimicrobium sp. IK TaxID=2871700 RepID=UPI0021CB0F13|nr:TIGR03617 family F420-dependent LLM class oxidoreductase [Acidiferrimicrobium sp. IK]MCU4187481.1 TIGR03617 family F420-dependent LLM class oxidoreductase [Acidiferrimicrobium sp. IK]
MKLDMMVAGLPLRAMQDSARAASAAGFDGLVITEAGRTAYLACAAAALAADIDVATGIAVAFARSPMVTAQIAWELAEVTGGRFRLGLGTQVRAHVVRRYGAEFDPPGPRLKEYVDAVRAIFDAFSGGGPLDVHGNWWNLSLLPAAWSPGPIGVPAPKIDVAGVNPWMIRMAGSTADGLHVHPLNTTAYLDQTVAPNVAAGAASAGRSPDAIEVMVPAFVAVGDTDEERSRWREIARMQVAFYGSTPNYAFIFEQIGHEGTTERIRERQKAGDVTGMARIVTDDMLGHFLIDSTWSDLPSHLADRYARRADRVIVYFAGLQLTEDPDAGQRWAEVAAALRSHDVNAIRKDKVP